MKRLTLFRSTLVLLLILSLPASAAQEREQNSGGRSQPFPIILRPGGSGTMPPTTAGQTNVPTVLNVFPATINQGQSGNLMITGRHLSGNMRIILGDGITTGPTTLLNDTGTNATVPISVAADATPGQRFLRVQYRDQVHQSQTRITVTAASVSPAVRTIVPNTLRPGQSYSLTLTGIHLEGVTEVNFGSGISAASPAAEGGRLRVAISVAADAQPGSRLVTLVDAGGSHVSSVAVTVAGSTSLPIALPITLNSDRPTKKQPSSTFSVQALLPNQWSQGKTYQVEVIGQNFSEDLEAALGDNIEIEDLTVASSNKLTMTVKVASAAAPGSRGLKLRTTASQPWNTFPAKAWVVAEKKWALNKPKPKLVTPDLRVEMKGRIELLAPEDFITSASMIPETLNEQTLFTWREKNPGLADWYEFRLVTENGFIIEKKRINPVSIDFLGTQVNQLPSFFKMDTAYLLDLLTKDRKIGENTVVHGLGAPLIVWWEVAGYKTYLTEKTISSSGSGQSGLTMVKTVTVAKDVEVEISDRKSLCTPRKPSGLACAGSAASASAINIVNPDKGNRAANYPGDRWELTGTLNLRYIPYATQVSGSVQSPGNIVTYIPNLFLDWGDGSGAIPLEIDLSKPSGIDIIPLGRTYYHRYEKSGNYTVRVFLLPDDDIQNGSPDALASVYDEVYGNTQASAGPVVLSSSSYNPYFKAIKGIQKTGDKDFQVSGLGQASFEFNENSLYAMAGRAHLIYCETKKIAFREDLVAQGPLHLESIAITGINGSGSSQQTISLPSKSGTTISLPKNQKTIPKKPSQSQNGSSQSGTSTGQMSHLVAGQAVTNAAGMVQAAPGTSAAAQAILNSLFDAQVSACDILQGNAGLTYYGEGTARITWRLKQGNSSIFISSVEKDLASPLRTEKGVVLTENTQNTPTPESYATEPLNSPVVEMTEEMVNKAYSLVVEAEVLPQVSHLSQEALFNLLDSSPAATYSFSGASGFAHNLFSWLVAEAHAAPTAVSTDRNLNAFQKSGVKLSILAPSKEGISGRPVMVSLNHFAEAKKFPEFQQKKEKPYYVKSEPFDFRVTASNPAQPCKFLFPTSTGDHFEIRNLEVTKTGDKFRGNGVLDLSLYTGQGGSAAHYILPIAISNWSVAADGLMVTSGSINLNLDYTLNEAGMRLQLQKLAAQAGQTPMNLTLNAKAGDPDLHLTGSSQPPEWTVTGPVSEAGDWYNSETANMEIEIGNSGFSIKPLEIVLDLSASQGMAANPNGAGPEWAGLHFGENAQLIPNLFEFQVPEANKGQVSNWGIEGTKLVGKTEIGAPFSTPYKEGTISFASISVDTGKSSLAIYRNLDVHLPWPETHLKGDARLVCGVPGQEAYFDFSAISQSEVVKEYRGVTMSVRDLLFGNFPQTGWAARADSTTFRFEAEDVIFAENVVAAGIIYAMDGRPFLDNGSDLEIALGGKSTLGLTPIDLNSVKLSCHQSGAAIFSFDFSTSFSISEVLSSVEVPVRYAINRDGNTYQAEGPYVTPFDLDVSFPAGQPNVEAKVHIEYSGGGLSSSTAAQEFQDNWWPFGITEAHAASGPQDRFNGTLDMAMFDGPPIQAEFRLGYLNGHDYWLMRATLDLGPSGTPFIPPFLKLYKIRGGLGHNFPIDAFKNAEALTYITPVVDNSYMFMAGMQVGSTDGFIVTMDGDLTIKIGDGARMDFRAWLLDATHNGNGNFQGYLQYTADGFDGALTGHLSFLSDTVYFDIPENACTLHFGGSEPWHIYAGQKNGPKLRMHLLIADSDGYMMLDEDGLGFGSSIHYYLGASIGHIEGNLDTGLAITSQPHVSGYADGGVRAEVCYKKCISAGISVRVDVSALPVHASARGCVTIPIPFWNPEICRTFSL